ASSLPHGSVFAGARDAELSRFVLDDVDVTDQIERVAHLGRGGHGLEEVATSVGEARDARAATRRRDLVVAGVHVDDERALRAAALGDDDEGDEARAVLHAIADAPGALGCDDVLAARAGERLAHVHASTKVAGHVLPLDAGLARTDAFEFVAAALGALALAVG